MTDRPVNANGRSSDPVIEFHDVSYRPSNGEAVLQEMNLVVERGETLLLLGRSGSGKTTSLKLINRLIRQSGGEVRVEGKSTTEWDLIQLRRGIGYVIQEAGLFPHYTVAKNVGLLLKIEKKSNAEIRERTEEMLRMVDLDPAQFADRYPYQLSGGQRQRVGVARALAADPPILLMDEPFGALDPLSRSELQQHFLRMRKQLHKTIILVTHDVREALLLGTRIALMESGKLLGTYTPEQFKSSNDPKVRAYLEAFGLFDREGETGKKTQ
jgi:osmoprotectant transport system ATP-binding protein